MSVRSLRYNTLEGRNWKGSTLDTDRDALAFLEAAQIYNTNQQRAIVNLVRSLKRVGLWTKMKAIYPFVGGTAASHKWNLKDPRDVDAAGRLTFNGGWTHNSNGISGNGTNTMANCNRTPAQLVTENSSHISIYSRTNSAESVWDFSSYISGTAFAHDIYLRSASNYYEMLSYQYNAQALQGTQTDSRGLFVNNRSSATNHKYFRNGAEIASRTQTVLGWSSLGANYAIGSNAASTIPFSARNYAFATIGDGLTDTDATNLYNIVDLYQKRLGRAV